MQDFDHVENKKLNLSRRTYHALVRSGILTIGDLKQYYENKDREQIRYIGQIALDEISKALKEISNNSLVLDQANKKPVQLNFHEKIESNSDLLFPIEVLGLPVSIRAMLIKHGIKTVDDLRKTPNS